MIYLCDTKKYALLLCVDVSSVCMHFGRILWGIGIMAEAAVELELTEWNRYPASCLHGTKLLWSTVEELAGKGKESGTRNEL